MGRENMSRPGFAYRPLLDTLPRWRDRQLKVGAVSSRAWEAVVGAALSPSRNL
jgi:hypothetical protein